MVRYIDADKELQRLPNDLPYKSSVKRVLLQAEEADVVEVKHGEWEKRQKLYGVGVEYVCSVCEKGIRQYEGQPICSECGAKMDGGKRNDL